MGFQISVPLHIKEDPLHLTRFIQTRDSIDRRLSPDFPHYWYLDANGCDPTTNDQLQRVFGDDPGTIFYIAPNGGRHAALNRSLQLARNNRAEGVLFLNDDVFPTRGTLETLASELKQGFPVVGAQSTPIDLSRSTNRNDRNSLSLSGELDFYRRSLRTRGPHFRGDCFGIDPNFIDGFPNIHGDDAYLNAVHQYRYSVPVPVVDGAQVFRYHETDVRAGVRRLVRYMEARRQLVDYCRDHEPHLFEIASRMSKEKGLKELRGDVNRELERLRARLGGADMNELEQDGDLSLLLGPYANSAMLYFALRDLNHGKRELLDDSSWRRK